MSKIVVPAIRIGKMVLHVTGESPLVCNRFHEKAIRMILDNQTGKPKQGKEPKIPADCFFRALYVMPETTPVLHDEEADSAWAEGQFGFPAIGFKASAVRAATDVGLKMTDMRRAFHIPCELVEILGDKPKMRMDMVRVGMGLADVRFRPEFTNWHVDIPINYNVGVINPEQIINLFRTAGFGVGVGEWRPENKGNWGRFSVPRENAADFLGEEEL